MGNARLSKTHLAILIGLLLNFSGALAAQNTGERATRGQFYANNPVGTIAWVPHANSRHAATTLRSVRVLGDTQCYQLPPQEIYWFVMNHRNVARAGEASFAAIRIEYDTGTDENFVHIYRNGGWYRDGRRLGGYFERSSARIDLTASQFVDMHTRPEGGFPPDRLSRVQESTDGFHAQIVRNGPSSWDQAYLLGWASNGEIEIDRLSIRLLRFSAMARNSSNHPVLFQLRRGNADGARITVDVPRFRSSQSRIVREICFEPSHC